MCETLAVIRKRRPPTKSSRAAVSFMSIPRIHGLMDRPNVNLVQELDGVPRGNSNSTKGTIERHRGQFTVHKINLAYTSERICNQTTALSL